MTDMIKNIRLAIIIRLTPERWNHVIEAHPELKDYKSLLIETVRNPDQIFYSEITTQFILMKSFQNFITDHLIVYVKKLETDAFVVTSHPISNKKLRRALRKWKKWNP